MSRDKEVRLLGLDGKNEFLDFFNTMSYKYIDILDKLGYQEFDNVVEIVRNKIYDIADRYEVEGEYFFYCSLSGDIIVKIFEYILKNQYNNLVKAYGTLGNKSIVGRFLYYASPTNWIIEYESLCEFCKNFKFEQIEEDFFESFVNTVTKEPFLSKKDNYIKSLKIELRYLTGDDKYDSKVDKCLVKSIGGKYND